MADVVLGSGVIGLHTAYYLAKAGKKVIVFDQNSADNNCSFGNAGYLSPSHFIPLAAPGIVWQGLKWMLDNTSPFYIKPRLSGALMKWGYHFYKSANHKKVTENAPHLYNLLLLSRNLSIDLHRDLDTNYPFFTDGCLMLCTNNESVKHETDLAMLAKKDFGLDIPLLSNKELKEMDPLISQNVLGAAYYPIDCHLHPGQMMSILKDYLLKIGVQFYFNEKNISFEKKDHKISKIIGENISVNPENIIIAAGSWSGQVASSLGIDLPLQAGKGYSYTYKNQEKNIKYPAILVDHRVAMTPLGTDLRVGGTMEIAGLDLTVSKNRIPPIINAANYYFDNLALNMPKPTEVWSGLRPLSPDGLPYIGKTKRFDNLFFGCGHAMIGISAAAATGLLLSQMITGQKTEIPVSAFDVNRFG